MTCAEELRCQKMIKHVKETVKISVTGKTGSQRTY